jgi:hypothetical protein
MNWMFYLQDLDRHSVWRWYWFALSVACYLAAFAAPAWVLTR